MRFLRSPFFFKPAKTILVPEWTLVLTYTVYDTSRSSRGQIKVKTYRESSSLDWQDIYPRLRRSRQYQSLKYMVKYGIYHIEITFVGVGVSVTSGLTSSTSDKSVEVWSLHLAVLPHYKSDIEHIFGRIIFFLWLLTFFSILKNWALLFFNLIKFHGPNGLWIPDHSFFAIFLIGKMFFSLFLQVQGLWNTIEFE